MYSRRHGLAARMTAAAALISLSAAGFAATATAAQAAPASGKLTLTALKFAPGHIDASAGGATAALNWTVRDSSAGATTVSGDVYLQLAGPASGTYVGQVYAIPYSLYSGAGVTSSGTAQDSSHSYAFAVPQYALATTAHWVVKKVTAQDDQGEKLSLSGSGLAGYSGVLTAREAVDSTPPTYDSLALGILAPGPRPYVYVGAAGGAMTYALNGNDTQSGFWKGLLALQGPGGRMLEASFTYLYDPTQDVGQCGANQAFDDTAASCAASVTFPAGIALGTWTVSKITLWDNAGNHASYTGLNALPITVTANSVVSASKFAATPDPVNNWTQNQTVQISMAVSGAKDGVAAIYVDFRPGDPCPQPVTTPTAAPGGLVSVPVSVLQIASSCQVTGIAVVDGAGDLALYGSEYGAPDPGLTLSRVPDTTPPVATSASLSQTTLPESSTSGSDTLTVDVADAVAPVNGMSVTVFNSSGYPVGGGAGGVPSTLNGPVAFVVGLGGPLAPGVYTVGFMLTDAGGLESAYGYPTSQPAPSGPLQFTVTP